MKIIRMLPFLDKEEISELLESIIKGELKEDTIKIVTLLPFLEREQVSRLFDQALSGDARIRPASILPFMEESDYDALIDKLIASEIETISLDEVLPFLSETQIKKVFHLYLEKEKKQE